MKHGPAQNMETTTSALNVTAAAEVLRISPSTLRNFEKQGLIVSQRQGNGYRVFYRQDVIALKQKLDETKGNHTTTHYLPTSDTTKQKEASPIQVATSSKPFVVLTNKTKPTFKKGVAKFAVAVFLLMVLVETLGGQKLDEGTKALGIFNERYQTERQNNSPLASAVLAAQDVVTNYQINFNAPAKFNKETEITNTLTVQQLTTLIGGLDTKGANGNFGSGTVTAGTITATTGEIQNLTANVLTFAGSGTMNKLLAIDATTKATLEKSLIFKSTLIGLTAGIVNETYLAKAIKYKGNIDLGGVWSINGATVTSTGTEINYLTGATVTKGGIMFGDGTKISQDATKLYWDSVNGYLGIGNSAPSEALAVGTNNQFSVNTTGDITKINNVPYSWPAALPILPDLVLMNDGTGKMYWGGIGQINVLPNVLDFTEFKDALTLDNSTSIGLNNFNLSTIGTGNVYFDHTGFVTVAGNMGIGTTSPTEKLEVIGNVKVANGYDIYVAGEALVATQLGTRQYLANNYVTDGQTLTGSIEALDVAVNNIQTGTTGLWKIAASYIFPANASNVAITNTGELGIGTTSPTEAVDIIGRVHIAQSSTPVTVTDKLYNVSGNLIWNGLNLTAAGVLPTANAGQTLYSNGTTWSVSDNIYNNNGNVGIGTTNPTQKLDVNGAIKIEAGSDLYIEGEALRATVLGNRTYTNQYFVTNNQSFTASIDVVDSKLHDIVTGVTGMWFDAGSYIYPTSSSNVVITDSGEVGIGTTNPNAELHINGSQIKIQSNNPMLNFTNATDNVQLGYISNIFNGRMDIVQNQAQAMYFQTAGFERLKIGAQGDFSFNDGQMFLQETSGNLGIGTTNPTATLEVNGSLKASGTVMFSGLPTGNFVTTTTGGQLSYQQYIDLTSDVTGTLPVSKGGTGAITFATNGVLFGNSTSAVNSTAAPAIGQILIGGTNAVPLFVTMSGAGSIDGTGVLSLNLTRTNGISGTGTGIKLGGELTENTRVYDSLYDYLYMDIATGFVGIGTTAPTQKLDVNGSIKIANGSDLYIQGEALRATALGTRTYTNQYYVTNNESITTSINTFDNKIHDIIGGASGLWLNNGTYIYPNNSLSTVITNTGNLGIGITAPQYALDVIGTINFTGALRLSGQAGISGQLLVSNGNNNAPTWQNVSGIIATSGWSLLGNASTDPLQNFIGTTDSNPLIIKTNNHEAARVDTSGNLVFTTGKNIQIDTVRATGANGLALQDDAGNGIFIKDGGNVGIGTTAPSEKLEIYDGNIKLVRGAGSDPEIISTAGLRLRTATSDGADSSWVAITGGGASSVARGAGINGYGNEYSGGAGTKGGALEMFAGNVATGYITFITGGLDKVRILNNGNVGIGTTLPSAKLDVVGSLSASGTITFSSLPANNFVTTTSGGQLTTTSTIDLANKVSGTLPVTNGGTGLAIVPTNGVLFGNGTGALGVTSAPSSGQILMGNAGGIPTFTSMSGDGTLSSTGVLSLGVNFNNGLTRTGTNVQLGGVLTQNTRIYDSSYDYLYMNTATGNVGIGTTLPRNKLDVSGNMVIGSYAGVNTAPANGLLVSGNVGIGTTNPLYTLDVNGVGNFTKLGIGGTHATALLNVAGNGNFTGAVTITANGLPAFTVGGSNSGGNNGMMMQNTSNTANSNAGITIKTAGSLAGDPYIFFDTTQGANAWTIGSDNSNSGAFTFSNSSGSLGTNDRVTITNIGNVGIGTTNPSALLNVYNPASNAASSGIIAQNGVTNGGLSSFISVKNNSTGELMLSQYSTGSYTTSVPLGFTDYNNLSVFRAKNSSGFGLYTDNTSDLRLGVNSATALSIQGTTGNVGIGTTSPTTKLHLAGTTAADYAQIDTGLNFYQVPKPTTGLSAVVNAGAGNVNTGDHYYSVTFVTPLGESSIMTPVGPYTFDTGTSGQATVTIPVSTDYRVTKRRIYRSAAGASQYQQYLLAEVANNTTTTYNDNITDAQLGVIYAWYKPNTTNAQIKVNGAPLLFGDGYLTTVGINAGLNIKDNGGYYSTFIGYSAGKSVTTGSMNTFIGSAAGQAVTTTINNVAIGEFAGYGIISSGNVLIGNYAGSLNSVTGSNNTLIGDHTGYNLTGNSNSNVFIGTNTGYASATQIGNIFIGAHAGFYETGSSKLIIDNGPRANEATARTSSMLYGVFNTTVANQSLAINAGTINLNGNVGIGTTNPWAALSVNGAIRTGSDSTNYGGMSWVSGLNISTYNYGTPISMNGSSLYIASGANGNVGIGTTNPGEGIDAYAKMQLMGGLLIYDAIMDTTDNKSGFRFTRDSGNLYVDTKTTTGAKLYYRTGQGTQSGAARTWMVVDPANGNVGLSTATPQNRLDVFGNMAIGTYAGVNSAPAYGLLVSGNVFVGTTSPGSLSLANIPKMIINDGTNKDVIIGNVAMTVGTNPDMVSVGPGIAFERPNLGYMDNGLYTYLNASSSTNLAIKARYATVFLTGNSTTETMRLDGTGYVGIGTTLPQNKLDVSGNMVIGSYAGVNTAPANGLLVSGNVGIGTTNPTSKLHLKSSDVAGTATLILEATQPQINFGTDNLVRIARGGDTLYFGTGGFWRQTIDNAGNFAFNTNQLYVQQSTGNVGIGTTSPTAKLDVNGNIGLPSTTSTVGSILMNSQPYLHSFGSLTNTFMGYQAGNYTLSAGTAIENTMIGSIAGRALTTGDRNTALGYYAGRLLTTGTNNTIIGDQAGMTLTTTNNNTFVGQYAGMASTSYYQTAIGSGAGRWNSTGQNNTLVGSGSNSSGTTNGNTVAVGGDALASTITGYANTALGYNTDYFIPTTGAGAATAGSNLGIGSYYYRVSYVLSTGETNSSVLVSTVSTTAGNQAVALSSIAVYSGPYVCTARKIYRNKVGVYGNGPYYLVTTINDNTTTTYTDTTADTSLGAMLNDNSNSIMIGASAKAFKSYQIILGSSQDEIYLGKGIYSASPNTINVYATSGMGTDNAGANLVIGAGKGTGAAKGGDIHFQTATTGSTGSLFNSLATRMSILSTGYVGIGTTAPTKTLEVNGQSLFSDNVNLASDKFFNFAMGSSLRENTSGTLNLNANYNNILGAGNDTLINGDTDANGVGALYFGIGNPLYANAKMVLTNSGNVGIGTTAPISKLTVAGGITATAGGYNDGLTLLNNLGTGGTSISPNIAFKDFTNDILYVRKISTSLSILNNAGQTQVSLNTAGVSWFNAGNVGIGTQTPTSLLTLASTSAYESAPLGSELLAAGNTWTLASDWSGSFAAGFTHTTGAGNTGPVTNTTVTPSINGSYQVAYTVTGRNAGSFTITFGGVTSGTNTATGTWGPKATSTGTLAITPTFDFDGTVVISIKLISPYSPTFSMVDSTGASSFEIRNSPAALYNTFIGTNTGRYNTTGRSNVGTGYAVFNANTTGSWNTAQGYAALYSNTTGQSNTVQGYAALYSNTTGQSNTVQGFNALYSNTTGSWNTVQGYAALYSNTTGQSNTVQGYAALYSNTTGQNNTASGTQVLYSNTTGTDNTAQGYYALYSNTTGSYNIALGSNAGRFITGGAIANTAPYNSIYLGYGTMAKADGDTNEIVIGYRATGLGSNSVVLGNSSVTTTALRGNVGIGTTAPGAMLEIGAPTSDVIGLQIRPFSDTQTKKQLVILNNAGSEAFSILNGNLNLNEGGLGDGGNIAAYSKVNADSLVDIYSATLDRGAGNGGAGLGLGYKFSLENGAGNRVLVGRFKYAWGTPTAGAETSNFTIQNISAGTLVDAMTIQGANVGIGTTTPSSLLEVAGKGQFGTLASSTSQLTVLGGANGGAMITLSRSVGANISYNWSLSGGGLAFTDATNGTVVANMFGDASKNQLYIGSRLRASASTKASLLSAETIFSGVGTDLAAANFTIQGGLGTGAGTLGNIYFDTGVLGVTGTSAQNASTKMTILGNGNVGIGTTTPTSALDVVGDIKVSGAIYVSGTALTVPDFVFEPNYNLLSLTDLKSFIATNKHLPNVPSMTDYTGWSTTSMQERDMLMLQKVEELTLYTLEGDTQLQNLKTSLDTMVNQTTATLTAGTAPTIDLALTAKVDEITLQLTQMDTKIATLNDLIATLQVSATQTSQSTLAGQTPAQILTTIESTVNNFTTFVQTLGLTADDATKSLIVGNNMIVNGDTTLKNVTLTGNLMAGTIKLDTLESAINILGSSCYDNATGDHNTTLCQTQTLYLQKNLAGNIDMFNGNVVIETNGNATFKGNVVAKKVFAENISLVNNSDQTGSATLKAGDTEITIDTKSIGANAKILITASTSTKNQVIYVSDKVEGKSFTAKIDSALDTDIEFDWWLVNKE